MKTISIYSIHPCISNIQELLEQYHIGRLKEEYEFVWNPDSPDYLIVSDHIYSNKNIFEKFKNLWKTSKIKICFAGEAFTPDFNLFDYCIGWDLDLQYGDRYCLLPPSIEYPASNVMDKKENDIKSIDEAFKELKQKEAFCNFIYSNWRAHPMRDQLFHEISKYKNVDSLGRHLKNVDESIPSFYGNGVTNSNLKRRYKFSIASENAEFPGYTSEKIYTSLCAHTVPIYWGDPEISKYINPKSFINVRDYLSWNELLDKIKEVDNDDELWCKMISEPWQTEEQVQECKKRSENYLNYFRHIFNQNQQIAKRIPIGTHPDNYRKRFFYGYDSLFKRIKRKINHIMSNCKNINL